MNAPVKLKTAEPIDVQAGPGLHVFLAISGVMEDLAKEGITKSRKNTQQGYNFRGIDDVYNALAPFLSAHKLTITPVCLSRTKEVVPSKNGGSLFYVTVEMDFVLTSALDGSTITARTFGEAMDSGDKATNKAMSAAFKYMAMQQFCIPTEGDNDADSTTHQIGDAPAHTKGAEAPAPPTLSQRADRLEATMKAVKTNEALAKAWSLAEGLRKELDAKDPERLAELTFIHDAIEAEIAQEMEDAR